MNETQDHPLFTEEFYHNPYDTYRRAREQHPVLWYEEGNTWFVTGYEEVETMLKDARFIREIDRIIPPQEEQPIPAALKPLVDMQSNWMLFKDAPDHTRLRGFVTKAFTPQVVERLRPNIQSLAHDLLSSLQAREEIDLISDFAYPLPVIVIAKLLGVNAQDHHQFRHWSLRIAKTLDVTVTDEDRANGAQATMELMSYLKRLAADRTLEPQNDLPCSPRICNRLKTLSNQMKKALTRTSTVKQD